MCMSARVLPFCLAGMLPLLLGSCGETSPHATVYYKTPFGAKPGAEVPVQAAVPLPSGRGAWPAFVVVCQDPALSFQTGSQLSRKLMSATRVSGTLNAFRALPGYPLTYGMWVNESGVNARGTAHLEIDIQSQRGTLRVAGQEVMDFPVCTGENDSTPRGSFNITQKDAKHWSSLYDCPMPYFMRLTDGGVGLHVGELMGYPASHGCIRLPKEACRMIFQRVPMGTRVVVK